LPKKINFPPLNKNQKIQMDLIFYDITKKKEYSPIAKKLSPQYLNKYPYIINYID